MNPLDMLVSGASSTGTKHALARLILRRLAAVALSASILGIGTVAVFPQVAAAAVAPPADLQNIKEAVLSQVGYGPCPGVGIAASGYTLGNYATCKNGKSTGIQWCAVFAGWAWNQGGADVVSLTYTVSSFDTYGKNHGTKETSASYVPTIGDAVVFKDPVNGKLVHVAIVDYTSGSTVWAINGNLNNMVMASSFPMAVGKSTHTTSGTGMTDEYGNYMVVAEYIRPAVL